MGTDHPHEKDDSATGSDQDVVDEAEIINEIINNTFLWFL